MDDAAAIRRVAELFAPSARETILLENFDKHLTELSLIRRGLANTGTLLDLGGGVGVNLLCLRQLGYRGRFVLVDRLTEYDDANRMGASEQARANLRELDIELDERDFWPAYESGFSDGYFDVVTCFCVFEHLPSNPTKQMEELSRILRPGGTAIVGVPNAASAMKRLKLLAGVHPYAPFEDWIGARYFGHIREYTAPECATLIARSGLQLKSLVKSAAIPRARARNHYYRGRHALLSPTSLALGALYLAETLMPGLRDSIYAVAEKS